LWFFIRSWGGREIRREIVGEGECLIEKANNGETGHWWFLN
jgi:hypothetical protein